jgi:hypothetical protein
MPGSRTEAQRPVPGGSAPRTAREQPPSGPAVPPAVPPALPRRTREPGRPGIPHRRPLERPVLPQVLIRPGPPSSPAPPPAVRLRTATPPSAPPGPAPEPPAPVPPAPVPPAPGPSASTASPAPGPRGPVPPAPGPSAPAAPAPAAQQPPPSWPSVLATTVRLWARRRLRVLWPAKTGWQVVVVLALVAVIFAAGAVTVRLSASRAQPGSGQAGASGPGSGQRAAVDSALAAAAAQRQRAAAWVARQVSPAAIVACDPVMCAALQARGVPPGRLLVLPGSRPDPLGSDVIVATQAVRSQFGARLADVYAPVTLASFGTGPARIDIRVVAPDGAAAYRTQLAADLAARRAGGAQLLQNRRIQVSAAARAALTAGQVDARLLVTLPALAALHPIDIISFGGASPGASAGVPLRSADITGIVLPGGHQSAPLAVLSAFLRAQRSPYLPSSLDIVRIGPQQTVLSVGYSLPSPLGLLGSRG